MSVSTTDTFSPALITDCVRRVQRGAMLLDRKVPNWRTVMKKNKQQFNFKDGECCVLGTLEHFAGRMRVLRKKHAEREQHRGRFMVAAARLGLETSLIRFNSVKDYGFCWSTSGGQDSPESRLLDLLWREEFNATPREPVK